MHALNVVWNSMCLGCIMVAIIIGVLWGEAEIFKGALLQDSLFTVMSLFFVVIFAISSYKIRRALTSIASKNIYVNEGVMNTQLAVFATFLLTYTLVHVFNETRLYMIESEESYSEKVVCKVTFWYFVVNCIEKVSLIMILALILYMTVR